MNQRLSIAKITQNIFQTLARAFPIACASDEFGYFPQIKLPEPDWSTWDNYSPENVEEIARRLSRWDSDLSRLSSPEMDTETRTDINLLRKVLGTLYEQLSEIRSWESQPTFYLTLAGIGLAEALESEDPEAKHARAQTLSSFLDQAGHNLDKVPVLFRDIGMEMLADTRHYLVRMGKTLLELRNATEALDRFEDRLRYVPTRDDFILPRDLLERVINYHIRSDMNLQEINHVVDEEIRDVQSVLHREAAEYASLSQAGDSHQVSWLDIVNTIPGPNLGQNGLVGLFQTEVASIAQHCLDTSLVSPELAASCPVSVEPMPDFLSAIRSGASYSIPPQHPPRGGKFHIYTHQTSSGGSLGYLREYRMTCAHETYPGHHLLDASRWSLPRPARRVIEQPIFYEGWACFAEELMRLTGYFRNPGDHLLLTRRRFSHAIRCQVDLGLQCGEMNIPSAARYLEKTGISSDRALLLARKYTLNPGYQLCYTIGLRRFIHLYQRYGHNDPHRFARSVLGQGEILFADLEKVLQQQEN
jgi:hypothetical protein